jgi:DNA-binding NarL/FixJ family response regulator
LEATRQIRRAVSARILILTVHESDQVVTEVLDADAHGYVLKTDVGRTLVDFAPEADIIVTGIVLDDSVDGVDLVSRLRSADGTMHKPIIVLTAWAWRRERERAEHAGCDVFLSKPCLPDALLREVRLLLPTTHARLRRDR